MGDRLIQHLKTAVCLLSCHYFYDKKIDLKYGAKWPKITRGLKVIMTGCCESHFKTDRLGFRDGVEYTESAQYSFQPLGAELSCILQQSTCTQGLCKVWYVLFFSPSHPVDPCFFLLGGWTLVPLGSTAEVTVSCKCSGGCFWRVLPPTFISNIRLTSCNTCTVQELIR